VDVISATASVQDAVPGWREDVRLDAERESLGLYLTGHPIDQFRAELAGFTHGSIQSVCEKVDAQPQSNRRRKKERETVTAGLVVGMRTKNLNGGGKMGFATIDDRSARVDVLVGPELFESHQAILQKDQVLVVSGELGYDDFSGGFRVRAKSLYDLNSARQRFARKLWVKFDADLCANGFLDQMEATLEQYRGGTCQTVIRYRNQGGVADLALGEEWLIKPCSELLEKLDALHDKCVVELTY
ncbi:MAG: OB-fold nucleic acid binding domain-containing protein, partial [Pseudomonadota bacterium]